MSSPPTSPRICVMATSGPRDRGLGFAQWLRRGFLAETAPLARTALGSSHAVAGVRQTTVWSCAAHANSGLAPGSAPCPKSANGDIGRLVDAILFDETGR